MAKTKKKQPDVNLKNIRAFLRQYEADHPRSAGAAYRRNSASIRIRIVDPRFKGLDRVQREEMIWPLLDSLPDDAHADITFLLLLSPDEVESSPGNYEFEHPFPSRLSPTRRE